MKHTPYSHERKIGNRPLTNLSQWGNTSSNPAGNYMFKVNNRNTRARCKICLKLKIKTPERRYGVFIVNFEYISHLVLVFLLLTLSRQMPAGMSIMKTRTISSTPQHLLLILNRYCSQSYLVKVICQTQSNSKVFKDLRNGFIIVFKVFAPRLSPK